MSHAPSRETHDATAVGAERDGALVEQLRRGDAKAFELTYEAYRARLHSYFLRVVRHEPTALELSQETWLRVAMHARALSEDTNLRAWLFTVARNVFLSHRRWSLLDRERLAEFGLCAPRQEVPTPLELACRSELERRLELALGTLPASYREIVVLVAIEGFSPALAGEILGLAPTTLRKRLSRARAMLDAALTGMACEPQGSARTTLADAATGAPAASDGADEIPKDDHVTR